MCEKMTYTGFAGYRLVGKGDLLKVLRMCKRKFDDGCRERIVIYDDMSGETYDFELNGTVEEVERRLKEHPMLKSRIEEEGPKVQGRPKLGVVSREITLLPRHWEWIGEQSGGASAVIRRLIDAERKRGRSGQDYKKQQAATHRFMWDIAGNFDNFEEASRLLYRGDYKGLEEIIVTWPEDIFKHLATLIEKLKILDAEVRLAEKKK